MSPDSALPTIGHVVLSLDVGGLERVVATLARAQHESGARVAVYCLDRAGALAGALPPAGVPVHVVQRRERGFDASAVLRLSRMLRAGGAGVVHCHNHGALVYGSFAARLARCPGVVYTVHGAVTSQRSATRRFLKLGLVHEVVFVSAHARAIARAVGLDSDDHVHTVLNGVDVRAVAAGAGDGARIRASLSIPLDAPVCGNVARLTAAKDHLTLLDAMVVLRQEHPRAHCVLVGDGELRGELEQAANARGLQGAVHFLGARGDVGACLAAMDVFVLSSVTEGLAMTLLEAMAAARPIVATRVGGNPEVVEDGVTGVLVPPRDPRSLASSMAAVLADPARAAAMGSAGRERVRECFSLEAMARRYAEIYRAAARQPAGLAP